MHTTQTTHMTKVEEKDLLAEIIEHCPEGYVKSILASIQVEAESMINSDFAFIDLYMLRVQIVEGSAELLATQKEIHARKAEIGDLERKWRTLNEGISQLRETIKQFAKL